MRVTHYIKNLMPIERNREWLTGGIRLRHKLTYYPSIAFTILGVLFGRSRTISYLGTDFVFDNIATPLNLQNYPYEINKKILANMHIHPKTVLDIGGNLGQFSVTMNYALDGKAKIDVFEPNGEVFPLLRQNIAGLPNVKAYEYAIGPADKKAKMYYEPGRSATGSLLKSNASENLSRIEGVDVRMTDSIQPLTNRKKYDLVKIDVEGFEKTVVKTLDDIYFDYLFMEMSVDRERDYQHSEMLDILRKKFGDFDITYASPISVKGSTFDILLRFKDR